MRNIIRKIGFVCFLVFIAFITTTKASTTSLEPVTSGYDFSQSETKYLTTPKNLYTHTYIPNTFEAWINIDPNISGRAGIIAGSYPEDKSFGFEIFEGYPRLYWNEGEFDWKLSQTNKTTNFYVQTGNWVYLAFTREFINPNDDPATTLDKQASSKFTCYVYKDGNWAIATKTGLSSNIAVNNFCIGRDKRTTASFTAFKGKIADLRIHRYPRTESDIKKGHLKANYTPSIGWYKLDKSQTPSQFIDSGPRQNHAALATFKTTVRNGKTVMDDWINFTTPSYFGQNEDDFSVVFVGDPQSLSYLSETRAGITDVYKSMGRWTKNNKDKYNIQFLNVLGDVTWYNSKRNNGSGTNYEWQIARDTWGLLNDNVPYILNPGNHDYYRRVNDTPWYYTYRDLTDMNNTFPAREYTSWDSWGGAFEEGDIGNVYHKFNVGDYKYLIMGLEFFPRDEVLEWANEVVTRHPDHRVIVTTHAYLGGTGYRSSGIGDGYAAGLVAGDTPYGEGSTTNTGAGMWDHFIKKHSNIAMVVSGHVITENITYRVDKGINGNDVYQFLINPQGLDADDIRDWGGLGYGLISMFMFSNDGKTIDVRYYSPSKNKSYRACNQFTFNIEYADSPEMTSISMAELPYKTVYNVGEELNLAGSKINIKSRVTSFNKTVYITNSMVNGYNPNQVGEQTITVTYGNKSTSFKVDVQKEKLNFSDENSFGLLTTKNILGENEGEKTTEVIPYGKDYPLEVSDLNNYQFLCFLENNFLLKNTFNYIDRTYPYNMTVDSVIDYVYKPNDKHAVIFIDSNNYVLGIKYVDDNESINSFDFLDLSSLNKPANTYIGWDKSLKNIQTNLIVQAVYKEDEQNSIFDLDFLITVQDETAYSTYYKYGEVATIYPKNFDNFVGWEINNQIVTRNPIYKFTVLEELNITAVYSNDEYLDVPLVNINALKNVNNKASFIGSYYLPQEYQLIDAGIILKKSLVAENLTLNSDDVVIVKALSLNNNSEFMVSIKNDLDSTVLQGRGYISFKKNGEDSIYTTYSDVSYHSYVDAYIVLNQAETSLFIEQDESKVYSSIAAAINAHKKQICLLPGIYEEPFVIDKNNITLFSLNKDQKGYSTKRQDEAVINTKITLTKNAKNLTINGLAFTLDGQIYANNVHGLNNFKFINNNVYNSNLEIDNTKLALLTFISNDGPTEAINVIENVNPAFIKNIINDFTISDNYFNGYTSNYITLWGIKNVDIQNNVFDRGMEAVRLHYSQGTVNITGNSFIENGMDDYGLRSFGRGNGAFTIMIQQTLSGEINITHNNFNNCAGGDSFMTPIRYYSGPSKTKVNPASLTININYNSFKNIITLSNNSNNYNKNYLVYLNDGPEIVGNVDNNYYDNPNYVLRINGKDINVNSFNNKYDLEDDLITDLNNDSKLSSEKITELFIVGEKEILSNVSSLKLNAYSNLSNYIIINDLIKWHSSNLNIATVNNDGLVTATGNGKVIISAYSKNNPNIKDSIEINVKSPVNVLAVGFKGYSPGNIINVNNLRYQIKENYPNIKEAVAASSDGSIILVNSGTYNDSFTVTKNNLNIISINAHKNPNINSRIDEAIIKGVITLGTSSTTITGFTLNGFSLTGGARVISSSKVNKFTFINNNLYDTSLNNNYSNAIIKLGEPQSTTGLIKSNGIKQVKDVVISNNKVSYATTSSNTNIALFVNLYGLYGTNNYFENNSITGGATSILFFYLVGDVYIQGNTFTKVGKAIDNGGHPIYLNRSAVNDSSNVIIRYNIFDDCKGQTSLYPMIRNYQGTGDNYITPINFQLDISHNLFINLANKGTPSTPVDSYYLYNGATKVRALKFTDNYVDSAAYHFRDGVLCNTTGISLNNTSYFASPGKLKHKWYGTGEMAGGDEILMQTLVSYHLITGSGSNINNLNSFNKLFYYQQQKNILDNNPAT